jgi:hypothetical protein
MVPSTVLGHLRVEKNLCPIQEPNHDSLEVQTLGVIIRTELCLILLINYFSFVCGLRYSDIVECDAEPLGEMLSTFPRNV